MFHWSIFTTYDATRFVLTVPMHYMGFVVCLPFVLALLAFTMKAGRPWRNWSMVAALVLVAGFLSYSSELTLDRRTGKATLREFEFYHWHTETFDLDRVSRVYVATGSRSDQLRLQLADGHIRRLTFMDQYGGKDVVAYKTNTFLGKIRKDE